MIILIIGHIASRVSTKLYHFDIITIISFIIIVINNRYG